MIIELDLGSYGFTNDDFGRFAQYDYLETYGTTIDELLDNARVYLTDQDGGELGERDIGETSYYEEFESLIRFEYNKTEGLTRLRAVK